MTRNIFDDIYYKIKRLREDNEAKYKGQASAANAVLRGAEAENIDNRAAGGYDIVGKTGSKGAQSDALSYSNGDLYSREEKLLKEVSAPWLMAQIKKEAGAVNKDSRGEKSLGSTAAIEAQKALNKLNFTDSEGNTLKVDGLFGPKTESAFKKAVKTLEEKDFWTSKKRSMPEEEQKKLFDKFNASDPENAVTKTVAAIKEFERKPELADVSKFYNTATSSGTTHVPSTPPDGDESKEKGKETSSKTTYEPLDYEEGKDTVSLIKAMAKGVDIGISKFKRTVEDINDVKKIIQKAFNNDLGLDGSLNELYRKYAKRIFNGSLFNNIVLDTLNNKKMLIDVDGKYTGLEVLTFQPLSDKKREEHYNYNKGFETVKDENGNIQNLNKGYIYSQNNGYVADMKFGDYNVSEKGCGMVATHNINVSLGIDSSPSEILKEFEQTGMFLKGKAGIHPDALAKYYIDRDFDVEISTKAKDFDETAKHSPYNIVMYFHGSGWHYVALERDNDGKYWGYNVSASNTGKMDVGFSIDDFLKLEEGTGLVLYSIKK